MAVAEKFGDRMVHRDANAPLLLRHSGTYSPSTLPAALPQTEILIGTRERLETLLTHRKQRTATRSNRYSPHRVRRVFHPDSRLRRGSRIITRAANRAVLPETAIRVETHVRHRKQKIGCRSTRDCLRRNSAELSREILAAGRAPALRKSPLRLGSLLSRSFTLSEVEGPLATSHCPKARKPSIMKLSRHRKAH